jgi:formyl-CoA transferase/succinyl-CoA--D-citramalate CoA-transferase
MFGVIGALSALTGARQSGVGQEVDVAIYEAVAALMESTMADYELAGVTRSRSGSVLPGVAPSNVYGTADGDEIIIAGNADSVFARLCTAMGRDDLATDERFATHEARGTNMAELDELIGAWTARLPTEGLLQLLGDHGVPAGQIFTAKEMLTDPHYASRGMVQRMLNARGASVPMTGVVPRFASTPGAIRSAGPALGEHTDVVLRELVGLDDGEIAALRAGGVLGTDGGVAPPEAGER